MNTAYRKGIVLFNNPLDDASKYITICGAEFPKANKGSQYGKVVVRGKNNGDYTEYKWTWEGEGTNHCDERRYNFNDMVIALKTKNKGGEKDLKGLVQNLVLYKNGDQSGTATIDIKNALGSNYPKDGEQCVSSGILGTGTTSWSDSIDSEFSKFINPRLGLKSVQCKSGTSAEIEVYYKG